MPGVSSSIPLRREVRTMVHPRRLLAALPLVALASLAGAQLQDKSANVHFYVPDRRPLPVDFFIVRNAEGLRVSPTFTSGNTWAFSNVGRKLSFEYTKKGLKYPSFEVVLEDAPVVYISILADPETGQVKYIRQKAQRPTAKPKITAGRPGGRVGLLVPPANDACANAIPIFDGLMPFSTVGATTDGAPVPVPPAQFDGQTYEDIWYL